MRLKVFHLTLDPPLKVVLTGDMVDTNSEIWFTHFLLNSADFHLPIRQKSYIIPVNIS